MAGRGAPYFHGHGRDRWRSPIHTSLIMRLPLGKIVTRCVLRIVLLCAVLAISGCNGVQSALDPAGRGAEQIARLFWTMAAGGVAIWLVMVSLTIYAVWSRHSHSERQAKLFIVAGGVAFPALTLAGLLIYGLMLLPELVGPAPPGSLKIAVSGEQWWWRVRYLPPGGEPVELANEIRLPVGEPVELQLESPDVIHSFWIPSLGGKVDMIPGRKTRLVLLPTRTGTFRGVCAEYCGSAHALMAFDAVVVEKVEFAHWLDAQRQSASEPREALATRGRELFLANGCGACHTVRGTPADGFVGPDLTHAGGRASIGAGTLRNERGAFLRWIAGSETIKPGVHMPAFDMLPRQDLAALAAYLEALK
jgi:cytochrome c oxidase subunit II